MVPISRVAWPLWLDGDDWSTTAVCRPFCKKFKWVHSQLAAHDISHIKHCTHLSFYSSPAASRTLDSHSFATSLAHKLRYITSRFVQYFFLFLRFLLLFTHFRRLGANYWEQRMPRDVPHSWTQQENITVVLVRRICQWTERFMWSKYGIAVDVVVDVVRVLRCVRSLAVRSAAGSAHREIARSMLRCLRANELWMGFFGT